MAAPSRKVDLNELFHRPGIKVDIQVKSPEPPEELQSRLRQQEADARFERTKDLIGYVAALAGVAAVVLCCLWVVIAQRSSPDDKKWATAILTSTVTAWVGYIAGKSKAQK